MAHDWGSEGHGPVAGAGPIREGVAGLAGSGAGCATVTSRVVIVPAKARRELLLPKLLRLMQANDELLRAEHDAIH